MGCAVTQPSLCSGLKEDSGAISARGKGCLRQSFCLASSCGEELAFQQRGGAVYQEQGFTDTSESRVLSASIQVPSPQASESISPSFRALVLTEKTLTWIMQVPLEDSYPSN